MRTDFVVHTHSRTIGTREDGARMTVYTAGWDDGPGAAGTASLVGGKAARLGALARLDGVDVPRGYCVTTAAYTRTLDDAPTVRAALERLRTADDAGAPAAAARVRAAIESRPVPADVAAAIAAAHAALLGDTPCAVRSSATAEDLPDASFAGQYDSFLDITGIDAVLEHIRRCWASLFTDRAVAYRRRHRGGATAMAVIVQAMAPAEVSGVLSTADPVTSDRTVTAIDAVRGLGDGLLSGRVPPETVRVRGGAVLADTALADAGRGDAALSSTGLAGTEPAGRVLTDARALALARLGRRIERHFGHPQDIEWCMAGDTIRVVQARPMTALFPVPRVDGSDGLGPRRVYVSVGHQQMMTDAIRPLGISVWSMTSPAPMRHAGGRLFVDVTGMLADPATGARLIETLGRSDGRIAAALQSVVDRDGFLAEGPADGAVPVPPATPPPLLDADPAAVTGLVAEAGAAHARAERALAAATGTALLDAIAEDLGALQRQLTSPRSGQVLATASAAAEWLADRLDEWLDDRGAADTLVRAVPHNITAEMGPALLEVADAARPHPAVVQLLRAIDPADPHPGLPAELAAAAGGDTAARALRGFLERYGMRCAGEIDITRARWSEHPAELVPAVLADIDRFAPGEGARRHAAGLRAYAEARRSVLDRVRALPDGGSKAEQTRRMIDRVRAFTGYREYPKYAMIRRYGLYRRALQSEAERQVRAGVLTAPDDVWYLHFDELRELVRTGRSRGPLIRARRAEFQAHRGLRAPLVLTSDGETIDAGHSRVGVPPGALAGLAVSAGVAEGRARVVATLADARLGPGDILVTACTDPGWTPVLLGIAGLVTEVGGVMTHGAVIAREYGLPAVVGVDGAARRIPDGALIRVDGTRGHVEILDEPSGVERRVRG